MSRLGVWLAGAKETSVAARGEATNRNDTGKNTCNMDEKDGDNVKEEMVNPKQYIGIVYPDDWDVDNNRNEYLERIDYIDLFDWIDNAKNNNTDFVIYELGKCLLDWS